MKVEYKVIAAQGAKEMFKDLEDYYIEDYEAVLVRFVDGEPEEHIWIDGHEPEDFYLCRDLSVFVKELNALSERLGG